MESIKEILKREEIEKSASFSVSLKDLRNRLYLLLIEKGYAVKEHDGNSRWVDRQTNYVNIMGRPCEVFIEICRPDSVYQEKKSEFDFVLVTVIRRD